jgi:hypothetical protein
MGEYPERSDSEDEHYGGFTGGGSDTLNNNTRKVRHNIVSLFHDEDFRKKITDENEQEFVNIFFYLIQNKKLNPYERYFYEEFYAYHTMEEDANIQQITEEDVNKLVEYYEGRLGLEKKSKISFPFHDKKMDVVLLLKKGEENETNNEGEEQNNNQETEDQIQGQKMVFKKLQKMYAYLNGIVNENYEPSDVDFLDDNCKNTDSMDGKIKCIEDKILAKITEINEKKPDNTAEQEPELEKKLDDMKKQILEKLKTGFAGLNINTKTENGNNLNAQINTIQRRIKEKFDEIKSKKSDTNSTPLQENTEEKEEDVDVYADLNLTPEQKNKIKFFEKIGAPCKNIAYDEIKDDEETMEKYFTMCCENKEKKKIVDRDIACMAKKKGKYFLQLPKKQQIEINKKKSKSKTTSTENKNQLKQFSRNVLRKAQQRWNAIKSNDSDSDDDSDSYHDWDNDEDPAAAGPGAFLAEIREEAKKNKEEAAKAAAPAPAPATASGDEGQGLMAQIRARAANKKKEAAKAAPAAADRTH